MQREKGIGDEKNDDDDNNSNNNGAESSMSTCGSMSRIAVLEDNPCWGSPTRHKLQDLLFLVHRNTSIVYDSPQYLVLNKPPDLRMDGPYPSTVHKLLTYWYPPPSLLATTGSTGKSETTQTMGNNNSDRDDTALLDAVSRLHTHNNLRDNFLRPCHQLDYATSGILLVAKTQEAAAHIGRLFEERHEGVQKSYVAVVMGDLRKGLLGLCKSTDSNDTATKIESGKTQSKTKLPTWKGGTTMRELRQQLELLEETYRRERAAVGKQHCRVRDGASGKGKKTSFAGSTFQGFQPAHAIFAKWKSQWQKKINPVPEADSPPKQPKKRRKFKKSTAASALLTDKDWKRIWDPVNEVAAGTETAAIDLQKLQWKQLNKEHPTLKQVIVQATDLHNNTLREAMRKEDLKELVDAGRRNTKGDIKSDSTSNSGKALPTMFRLSKDTEKIVDDDTRGSMRENDRDDSDTNDNTFFICCPLAQHPDRFNMVIPPSLAKEHPHLATSQPGTNGEEAMSENNNNKSQKSELKFRPSMTKCTVLEKGRFTIYQQGNSNSNSTETSTIEIDVTKVLLHPITGRRHQLRVHMAVAGFPILGDVAYGGNRGGIKKEQAHSETQETEDNNTMTIDACSRMYLHAQSLQLPALLGENNPNWKIVTPDPFVFAPDGELELS